MGDVETGEKSKKTKKKRFWPKVVLGGPAATDRSYCLGNLE
ncbi:hypothetical protein [Enterococcus olivae]